MTFQAEPDLQLVSSGPENPSGGQETAGSQPAGEVHDSSAQPGDLGEASAITTAEANVIDDDDESTFNVWTANVRAKKHVLGEPYSVYFFMGEFPRSDPSAWNLNPTTVGPVAILGHPENMGCDKCVADMADRLCVTGTVSLTEGLLDSYNGTINADDRLPSFDDETVEKYLTKNLHWRVALADHTEVSRDQVPGLVVCVSSVKMRMDENGVPVSDPEHTVHPGITDERPAGLREGDEI
jgi:tyrosinase